MENEMETTTMGYIGIILRFYWVYNGIMEKKMETTIMGYIGIILGFFGGYIGISRGCRDLGSRGL